MKTDFNLGNGIKAGLQGWVGTTPKWAAIASNYLMLATVLLFVVSAFVSDWSEFIPMETQETINSIIEAMEKSFITIGTALRFLGRKNDE